jgi:membrane protease YdiL (CAAX protease family)
MSVGPTGPQGSAQPELAQSKPTQSELMQAAVGESPPAPPAPSPLHRIFVGPDGLRPGWGVLMFIALVAAIGWVLRIVLARVPHSHPDPASATALEIGEGVSVLIIMIATAIMARIEGRSVLDYGLRDARWGSRFAAGALWGFILISGLVGLLYVLGFLSFDGLLLHGSTVAVDALWLGLGFLLVGLTEEIGTRGYLLSTLARGIGFWPAAVLTSIAFGALHLANPGEGPYGAFIAGLAGFVFCVTLYRTGSLWWGIGAHLAWDWGQSYFYGVPDSGSMVNGHLMATHPMGPAWLSGGAVGPEGSIFALVAFGAVVPIILLTTRGRGTTPPSSAPPASLPA